MSLDGDESWMDRFRVYFQRLGRKDDGRRVARRSIILPRRSSLGQRRLASRSPSSMRSLHPETRLTGGLFITGDASRKNNYLVEVETSDFRLPPSFHGSVLRP